MNGLHWLPPWYFPIAKLPSGFIEYDITVSRYRVCSSAIDSRKSWPRVLVLRTSSLANDNAILADRIAPAAIIRLVGQLDGGIAQAHAAIVAAFHLGSRHTGSAVGGQEKSSVGAHAMLQRELSVAQVLAVVVAIAGLVIGYKSSRLWTYTLLDDIWHWDEVTLHILRIIALGRGGLEVEGARTGSIDHLAIPAHLIAIAAVRVLDKDPIRQDVAIAIRIHLIRARKIPDAVLRARIEVHPSGAHSVRPLAILAVVITVAGVRISRESGGHSGARITGQTLDTTGTQAFLALPVVEESSRTATTHSDPIDALNPRVARPRIVHLGSVDHQAAY
ncbi:GD12211 [Drosophila simulans]|uniref:GD12211 n=1 Tax=Drosophila simulans TaxID=7240 RepID=B4QRU5_DROSI|nr:GD12211 [Drosophila simulans]